MNATEYHPFAKFLHWIVVLLVAIQFVSSWLMPESEHNGIPNLFNDLHMSFGVIVLPFVVALLSMHFLRPTEKPEMNPPTFQGRAAFWVHSVLYVLLIILPFNGWAAASFAGIPVNIFGVFELPALAVQGSSLGYLFAESHGLFASTVGFLVIGHIAAALYHQVILKDGVLDRMRPNFRKKVS